MELVWVKEGRLKIAPRTFLDQGDVIPDGLIEPEKIREYIARGWVMRVKPAPEVVEDIEVVPNVVVRAGVREPEKGVIDEQKERDGSKARKRGRPRK